MQAINSPQEQQESQAVAHAIEPPKRGGYADDTSPAQAEAEGKKLQAHQHAMRQAPLAIQQQNNYEPLQAGEEAVQVRLLRPFTRESNNYTPVKFLKTKVVLELTTAGELSPDILKKVLQLSYGEDTTEKIPLNSLIKEEEGRYYIEWELSLPETFQKGQRAKADLLNNTFVFDYRPVDTNTLTEPEAAKKFVSNSTSWSSKQVLLQYDSDVVLGLLPDLPHTESGQYIKVDMEEVVAFLEKELEFSEELPLDSLYELDKDALNNKLVQQLNKIKVIESLLLGVSRHDEPLEDLPNNYQGTEVDELFGAAYQATIATNNQVQATLEQYRTRFVQEERSIRTAKENAAMPPALREKSRTTMDYRTVVQEQLLTLEEEVHRYEEQPPNWSFEEWKAKLEALDQQITTIQEAWNKEFTLLETAVTNYEASQEGQALSKPYTYWKKRDYQRLSQQAEDIQASKAFIQEKLAGQQAAIERTGGDGELEYQPGENKVDDTELAAFGQNYTSLGFKTPDVPLYANGVAPEDINQNGVGDCYLLACLATLAQGEGKALIQQAIEDRGDHFVVTLYQKGVPVKVGVDRAMLYGSLKTDEYEGGNYLGASPEQELWVAVIEKAYAKLESGGKEADYSKIELNTTQYAFSVLLGSQQQSPDQLYLDAQGQLSDQATERAFKNPLPLDKTAPEDIASIAQACDAAGYLMTVGSPAEFEGAKGLTHNHVVSLGDKNYMHLKHAYAVEKVEAKKMTLLNPHGKNAGIDRQTYSPDLKVIGEKLENVLKQLTEDLEVSKRKRFSNSTKESMEKALMPFYWSNRKTADENGVDNENIRKLGRLWNRVLTKATKKGEEWIVEKKDIKIITTKLPEFVKAFITSDFRNGFKSKSSLKIDAVQNLSYEVLGKYFASLDIFKIT